MLLPTCLNHGWGRFPVPIIFECPHKEAEVPHGFSSNSVAITEVILYGNNK
jgi:hypothetical protein